MIFILQYVVHQLNNGKVNIVWHLQSHQMLATESISLPDWSFPVCPIDYFILVVFVD